MAEFKFKSKDKFFNPACSNQLVFNSYSEGYYDNCVKETCVDPYYSGFFTGCPALWTPISTYPGYEWDIYQVWSTSGNYKWFPNTDYYERFYDLDASGTKIGDNQTFQTAAPLSYGSCPSGVGNNLPWRIEEDPDINRVYGSGIHDGVNWSITWSGGGNGYCREKFFTAPSRLGWEDCGNVNYIHAEDPFTMGIDVNKDLRNTFDFVGEAGGICDDVYTERTYDTYWRLLGSDGQSYGDNSADTTFQASGVYTIREALLPVDPQPSIDAFIHFSGGPSTTLQYWVGYDSTLFPSITAPATLADFTRSSIYNVAGFSPENIIGRQYNRDDADPDTELLEILDLEDAKVGLSPAIGQMQYNRITQTDTLTFSDGDFKTESMVEHYVENSTQYKMVIDKVYVQKVTPIRIMDLNNILAGFGTNQTKNFNFYSNNDQDPSYPVAGTQYEVLINTTTEQVSNIDVFVKKDHGNLSNESWVISPFDAGPAFPFPGPQPVFASGWGWSNNPSFGMALEQITSPSGDLDIYCDIEAVVEYRVVLANNNTGTTDLIEFEKDGSGGRLIGQLVNPGTSGVITKMYEYGQSTPPFGALNPDVGSYLLGPCENSKLGETEFTAQNAVFNPDQSTLGTCVGTNANLFTANAILQDRQGGDWVTNYWNGPSQELANLLCVENSGHHAHSTYNTFVSGINSLTADYSVIKTFAPNGPDELEAQSDFWNRDLTVPSPRAYGVNHRITPKSTDCCHDWATARMYFDASGVSGWTSNHDEDIQYEVQGTDGELLRYCRETDIVENPNDYGRFVWSGKSKHFVPRGCNDLKWNSNQSQFPWISPSGRLAYGVLVPDVFPNLMCGTTVKPSGCA